MFRTFSFLLITILASLLSTGCFIPKLSADMRVDSDLNNPIMLDFVFVFENNVFNELQKTPSMQWFEKRDQYKFDWILNEKIQVLSYELVPGQTVALKNFKPVGRPEGLIIFASYLTQGDHRIVLKDYSELELILTKDDFLIKTSLSEPLNPILGIGAGSFSDGKKGDSSKGSSALDNYSTLPKIPDMPTFPKFNAPDSSKYKEFENYNPIESQAK